MESQDSKLWIVFGITLQGRAASVLICKIMDCNLHLNDIAVKYKQLYFKISGFHI